MGFQEIHRRPAAETLYKAAMMMQKMIEEMAHVAPAELVLIGILTWVAVGRRPLLAMFHFVFKAIHSKSVPKSLSNIVKREISNFGALRPAAVVPLQRQQWETVIATDASNHAGAVVFSRSTTQEMENLVHDSMYVGVRFTSQLQSANS